MQGEGESGHDASTRYDKHRRIEGANVVQGIPLDGE